jgi:hypothetical protein
MHGNTRREVLIAITASSVAPQVLSQQPGHEMGMATVVGPYTPKVLTASEMNWLGHLADAIIGSTPMPKRRPSFWSFTFALDFRNLRNLRLLEFATTTRYLPVMKRTAVNLAPGGPNEAVSQRRGRSGVLSGTQLPQLLSNCRVG